MITTPILSSLPAEHPLRNQPIAGAQYRVFCFHGEDIAIPPEKRGPDWRYRKWSAWRTVLPTWKIAPFHYNHLGPSWTEDAEWRFPEQL